MTLHLKRIYADPADSDGYRVLVDRLWPRGMSKDRAQLDEWLKDIAPTTELRQWFHHEESKWPEFRERYRRELDGNPAVQELRRILAEQGVVTLLYGAHSETENQAVVLAEYLAEPSTG
jgi:uncharacterized protein YeaO (DUF488 family)